MYFVKMVYLASINKVHEFQIMYQCTYPGCHEQRLSVDAIESHVRVEHLNRPEELDLTIDEADRDHEEEFYYTETEYEEVIDVEPPQLQVFIPTINRDFSHLCKI